ADIVIDQLGLNNIKLSCTGGVNGGRGWIGDVRKMHLSINKILKAGWKPKFSSEDAIRLTVKTLGD
ncbi:MAG: UDP-glucose 4-epimerase, partial [Candidatus Bathyarchaeota archaeon]|nr:UDP-glucose 4-epimerase [Candidatus Bathyarchaeota archaeon]